MRIQCYKVTDFYGNFTKICQDVSGYSRLEVGESPPVFNHFGSVYSLL
jgi:hypothetical protein